MNEKSYIFLATDIHKFILERDNSVVFLGFNGIIIYVMLSEHPAVVFYLLFCYFHPSNVTIMQETQSLKLF